MLSFYEVICFPSFCALLYQNRVVFVEDSAFFLLNLRLRYPDSPVLCIYLLKQNSVVVPDEIHEN